MMVGQHRGVRFSRGRMVWDEADKEAETRLFRVVESMKRGWILF